MLQINNYVVKYSVIDASICNILGVCHCCFHACPQYTARASLDFLVANIEYLTTEMPLSNKSIIFVNYFIWTQQFAFLPLCTFLSCHW